MPEDKSIPVPPPETKESNPNEEKRNQIQSELNKLAQDHNELHNNITDAIGRRDMMRTGIIRLEGKLEAYNELLGNVTKMEPPVDLPPIEEPTEESTKP